MTLETLRLDTIDTSKLHVLFVGGCGSFGMNMTAYIYKNKLYIVDVGLAFASEYEIGIDSHVPNIDDLVREFGKVEAYFITHGHEDHVGALPLILEKWPAPVFMTKWTSKIFEDRVQKFGSKIQPEINIVAAGDRISTSDITVDWFHVPHSIPGCCSLIIRTDNGTSVFHTGDFKFDLDPYDESSPDIEYLKGIAPVTALIADSTNSQKPGRCPSEKEVMAPLEQAFRECSGLTVFTTFSSNFWRLKIVLETAKKINKKVFISGASLAKTLEIAGSVKAYHPPENLIIDDSQLHHHNRSEIIVIASGSQGEPRSGLRRIIQGEHKHIRLQENDSIIMSSRVIPGNEKSVAHLVSAANKQGVSVKTNHSNPGIHVSGHGHQDDLNDFIKYLRPKFYIPVHGTFSQLIANTDLHPHSVDVENGTLLSVDENGIETLETFGFERFFVDSWSHRPMSYDSMRKRHKIGDSGMALLTGTRGKLDIEFVGLPFEDKEVNPAAESLVKEIEASWEKFSQAEDLNEWARLLVRRYLSSKFVKKPVVYSKLTI